MTIPVPEWLARLWYWWNEPVITPRRHQIIAYIVLIVLALRFIGRIVSVLV